MSLTPKQEAFAQAIADGMTQADAYRAAFDVKPTTRPETVQDSASKLMKNPEVSQRVEELRGKLEAKALWSREMSVKALVKAYQVATAKDNASGMTAAVRELNLMHGYNEPQRIDVKTVLLPASIDDFV